MNNCPECDKGKLYQFLDKASGFIIIQICWECGYYESDSQAYKSHPEEFKNIVRQNPTYFLRKCYRATNKTPKLNTKKNNDTNPKDLPEVDIKFWSESCN